MHVAFGRVRRKSRIVADYTDCADFKELCLPTEDLVRISVGNQSIRVLMNGRTREPSSLLQKNAKASGIGVSSYEQKDREPSSLLQKNSQKASGIGVPSYQEMDLAPEQYFVYAWRYGDDAVCKLGVGTLRTFYARIKAAKTVTYQDIELLGIEVFGTEAEARTAYRERLEKV